MAIIIWRRFFLKKKLNELKTRYSEDLKAQMTNQRNMMNNMKESFEKNKQLELELQTEAHTKAIGKLSFHARFPF